MFFKCVIYINFCDILRYVWLTIQGDLFMGKTNLKIEYILKASNNIEFDNIDTYISRKNIWTL